MRVLFFVEGALPERGGVGLAVVPWIASSFAARGHQVSLVVGGRPSPGTEQWLQPNLASARAHPQSMGTFSMVTLDAYGKWRFTPALVPQVHSYARTADFIGLHSLYSFPVLAGFGLAQWYHKPYGMWLHGVLAPFLRQVSPGKKALYDHLFARRILDSASVIFFASQQECAQTRELNLRAPSAIVPLGFQNQATPEPPRRGSLRASHLGGHSGPVVLFLSRINPFKGVELLIQAFALVAAQLPTARLVIAGASDPPEFEPQVKRWLREYQIEHTTVLTGVLNGQMKQDAFADADVFVLPSYGESFGYAMFEAMASRVPIVISDTLSYAETVREAGAGLVVRRHANEFANAILMILDHPEQSRAMGKRGLELVKQFSWNTSAEKTERVIQAVLGEQPLPADVTPKVLPSP